MTTNVTRDAIMFCCDRRGCDAAIEDRGPKPPPPWVMLETRDGDMHFCGARHAMEWRMKRLREYA